MVLIARYQVSNPVGGRQWGGLGYLASAGISLMTDLSCPGTMDSSTLPDLTRRVAQTYGQVTSSALWEKF